MWQEDGPHALLHKLNYLRIPFIIESLTHNFNVTSLKGLKILDVGCASGILSEPLSRLGAHVMGVDQDYNAIEEAKKNTKHVTYFHENIASCTFNTQFDCIVLSEVIEHIKDRFLVLSHLSQFLKEDGVMIISTLNKTWQSYVGAILCAEHLLRFVPRGTHDWHDFMKPSELEHDLKENNLKMINIKGMYYNFLTKNWKWCSSLKMNYIIAAQKNRLNLLENKAI